MITRRLSPRAATILLLAASVWTAIGFQSPTHERLPDFDKRKPAGVQTAILPAQRASALNQLNARVAGLRVEFDEVLGTPKFVGSTDRFLSGSNGEGLAVSAAAARQVPANDPHRAIKTFLNDHAALYGHGAEVLASARAKRDYVTAHNGLRTTVWEQYLDEIPIFEAVLIGHITKRGELVNLSSQFLPSPRQAADAGTPNRVVIQTQPRIAAQQAIANAAKNIGIEIRSSELALADQGADRVDKRQRFAAAAIRGPVECGLVWLPMKRDAMRLCWEVTLKEPKHGETFRLLVDAETGEVLLRQCLTLYISDASYRVFPSDSPSPFSPGHSTPSSAQPPVVARALVVTNAFNTNASPLGWISDGVNETRGNNVDGHLDRDANDAPDLPRPQGTPFRIFDFPIDFSQAPTTYSSAAVVQLFYWCNFMHDKLWELGFTEAAGNFQNNNFSRGGLGNDALLADAQDGDGFNNANYTPTPDGTAPRIQMFLFNGPNPDRDGDFDGEIVIHEYTHGLSTRLVGGGVGISALQTAGMGEGWSDWYALTLLSEPGDDPGGNYAAGGYATYQFFGLAENYYFGIRRYPYSTNLLINPLTFKDIDPTQASSHSGIPRSPIFGGGSPAEVHNQGEVWCVTLWEARANLIAKHGFAVGNQLILRLVTDGMKLSPVNPNFLQARDAILQADQVLTGGANRAELWAAFAKRGMGFNAIAPSSSTTTPVEENFDLPDDLQIRPLGTFVASGPVGGPFTPSQRSFTLSNLGSQPVTWTARSGGLIELSATTGALPPGGPGFLVVAGVGSAAAILPDGIYSDAITFSNHNSGLVQSRAVSVRIGQPDFLTEVFDANDNDLDNQTLTFTPDGSPSSYAVCRTSASAFPTDPAGGTTLTLTDDSFTGVSLAAGARVALFGVTYSNIYVGANGYLTFTSGDVVPSSSPAAHFRIPRVSGLMMDLDPAAGGSISWKQLSNRVAITWQNVPEFFTANANSFQIELYFDGVIQITYLAINSSDRLAGLSRGGGTPPGFVESNLSGYGPCLPALLVSVPEFANETSGVLSGEGLITIPAPLAADRTFTLSSSNPNEVSVPSEVIIPAGQTNAEFELTIIDDAVLDGSQAARVTATGSGYRSGDDVIVVHDNESATLSIALPSSAREGDGLLRRQGTVTLTAPAASSVVVRLSAEDTNELIVPPPAIVIVPAGQTSASFDLSVVDDRRIDGTQDATIIAHVENWTDGVGSMNILDNESTDLILVLPSIVSEGDGILTNGGSVRLSGTLPTNLVVLLISNDPDELNVPAVVTIQAGETIGGFDLNVGEDSEIDSTQTVNISGSAAAFTSSSVNVLVLDNEVPPVPYGPSPPHLSSNVAVNVDLRWGSGEGEQIINGDFESGDLFGWLTETTGRGDFVINNGGFDPVGPEAPMPPYAGAFSALSQQTDPGRRAIYQEVFLPSGAPFATLRWTDRIRNQASDFSTNQQFRVEVRDQSNNVLGVLFATGPGDSLLNDWTNRSADLRAFRGRTVRVAFVEDDSANYLNVHLDNVSLLVGAPAATSFHVYFGQNPVLGPGELLGTATNSAWDLPLLSRATVYYWQIIAQRGSVQVPGPIWQFRTAGLPISLIPTGAVWKYLDDGSNQGTAWRASAFDDNAWASGRAQLGYGDIDERTVVRFGTNSANKHITTYFRHSFVLSDTSTLPDLNLRLLRDDGAVVYLNGTEILRSNMPEPPAQIFFNTFASSDVLPPEESAFLPAATDRNILVSGTNVVAVEIHQFATNSSDISFDFQLTTSLPGSNLPPTVTITNPANYAAFTAPVSIGIGVTTSDIDGVVRKVEFFTNGVKQAEDSLAPFGINWTSVPPGTYTLTAVATDDGGESAISPVVTLVVNRGGLTPFTLISTGAVWKYLDNGSDQGTIWRRVDFGDDSWLAGPAQLGYGDGDEATIVSFGPNPTNKYITTYFRHAFTNDAVFSNLVVNLLRDDGGVVYLNDVEVFRSSMPAGAINYLTRANGTTEESRFFSNNVNVARLQRGQNVLAVEIHQASPVSSDISFDLELRGFGNFPPEVAITAPLNNSIYDLPQDIPVTAIASDSYGTIAKVSFYSGSTLIAEDLSRPYSATMTNVAPGTHALTAVALDNLGATNRSGAIIITVNPPPSLIIGPSTNGVVLSWPVSPEGFTLEFTTNLTPIAQWTPVTNQVQRAENRNSVTIDSSIQQLFFRLVKP